MVAASVDAQLDRVSHEHAAYITSVDAANAYYRRVVRESGVPNVDQEASAPPASLQSGESIGGVSCLIGCLHVAD
jgi:hypothetical protein